MLRSVVIPMEEVINDTYDIDQLTVNLILGVHYAGDCIAKV